MTEFPPFLPSYSTLRLPAACWRLWSSTLPLWRARRPRSWMQTPGRHVIIGQRHQPFSSLRHLHFHHMKFHRSSSRVLPKKEKLNTTSVFSPFSYVCRASTLSNAVSSLSSTGMSFSRMDEKEKQQALEEEQARLQALKVTNFILFGQIVSGSKQGRVRAAAAERPAAAGQVVTAVSPFKRLFKWHHLIQFIRFRAAPARHSHFFPHIQ